MDGFPLLTKGTSDPFPKRANPLLSIPFSELLDLSLDLDLNEAPPKSTYVHLLVIHHY